MASRATAVRLFLTGWILFSAHFSSNVVRETYLAITLAEDFSVRVDDYMGLHPDLFEIPGRGAYINSNPGASILGAVPYALARPFLAALYTARPGLLAARPPATYDDPRENRTTFMNESRARGLDIKLGLAAAITLVGLMAPVSALSMVLMYWFLSARLRNERQAMWLALLYGFGTPVFFRTAFLNQNLLLAHVVLIAFAALTWPGEPDGRGHRRAHFVAGFCLGFGILLDYSAAPLALAFGAWIMMVRAMEGGGPVAALRGGLEFALGAVGPMVALFGYQWLAFGSPWFPAQRYMPATELSVRGWNGMTLPTVDLLVGNLFDPTYGLVAFCPMLLAALAAPFLRQRPGGPSSRELVLVYGATVALWLFASANQFSHLQFNTGVRYMVPAVPLLFLALVPVLLRAPRVLVWALLLPTVAISWSVSMARESVPISLARVFMMGPELPWVTVLGRMASGYAPFLTDGVSPIAILVLLAAVVWLIWRGGDPRAPLSAPGR
ncbi:MAG: hypothetical protein ABL963_16585 [Longimicrobiales bacterium]